MTVLVLRCACCGLPWATLRDGTLEVASRHNGKIHLNRIDVETLAEVKAFAVSGVGVVAGAAGGVVAGAAGGCQVSGEVEPATHWPECWREPGHHACAVAEIERLRQAVPDEQTERVFRWHWQHDLKANPLAEGRKDDMILEAVCDGLGTWWARLFTRQQVAARLLDGSLVNHWTAEVRFPNPEGT